MPEEVNYDLTPREETVTIGGNYYILREADGNASTRYSNARLKYTEVRGDKVVAIEGMADTEPLLVSLCLFTQEGKPVPEVVIRKWPSRVQSALFDRAKRISNIDQPMDLNALRNARDVIDRRIKELEEDSLGNSPSGTTDG